jgi:CubicO group peptidase (beta-lactamase class C family)
MLAGSALLSVLLLAPKSPAARAAALLEDLRASSGAPSVTGAVACRGEMAFTGAAGLAVLDPPRPATPDTVYNVGSVSKAITAVAVMQQVEAGRVRLDDPIRKWMPSFPDKGAPVTVWNLLTHTSGIRHYRVHDFPGPDWEENHRPYASIDEAIAIFKDDPLLFPPGKLWSYTSYGVNLLQGVVEKASGRTFEEDLRTRIFAPAGMTRSSLDVAGRVVADRARGYAKRKDGALVPTPDVDVSYKYASGGMLATAPDLVRLVVAIENGKLLGRDARARLFAPHVPAVRHFHEDGPPTTHRFQQALLWRIVHRPGGRTFVYECGTFNGFNACVLDEPAAHLAAAMALNAEEGGLKPLEELAGLFRASCR